MPTDWKDALDLFDRALVMSDEERSAWLVDLHRSEPELARKLTAMLEAHDADSDGNLDQRVLEAAIDASESIEATRGLAAGRMIGPYCLLHSLGRGGMASVWLSERIEGTLRREFALKLPWMAGLDGVSAERFLRERDILARLRHPNIARLHDAGVDSGGQPYLALDHIEGQALTAWCDERALPIDARLERFGQVLDAVQYAHANLVIHRDIKPANILIDAQGRASLLDFGIAKLLDASGTGTPETELTAAGGRLLTMQYASPEQLRGESLTIATDIYSLSSSRRLQKVGVKSTYCHSRLVKLPFPHGQTATH